VDLYSTYRFKNLLRTEFSRLMYFDMQAAKAINDYLSSVNT